MKVGKIVDALERIAPPELAAEWDNVGLLVGDRRADARTLLLCIDLTEQVLDEAVRSGAKMVMAYHPVIFKPIARVTAQEAAVVYGAASRGISVYSMHTALDTAPGGTNDVLAEVLGLVDSRPIEPVVRPDGYKLVVFTPPGELGSVAGAAFKAGAGRVGNYERCSFSTGGIGTFRGMAGSRPSVGKVGREEATDELRLEVTVPAGKLAEVCEAVRQAHSYEHPGIDVYPTREVPKGTGMGRIGKLAKPVTAATLIRRIKKRIGLRHVLLAEARRTVVGAEPGQLVSVAACCAGSCGKMYEAAAGGGATFYVTGEMKHHDALATIAAGMNVVCLGHSNSERMALKQIARQLVRTLPKLKVTTAQSDTDPFRVV